MHVNRGGAEPFKCAARGSYHTTIGGGRSGLTPYGAPRRGAVTRASLFWATPCDPSVWPEPRVVTNSATVARPARRWRWGRPSAPTGGGPYGPVPVAFVDAYQYHFGARDTVPRVPLSWLDGILAPLNGVARGAVTTAR